MIAYLFRKKLKRLTCKNNTSFNLTSTLIYHGIPSTSFKTTQFCSVKCRAILNENTDMSLNEHKNEKSGNTTT